jgi:small multidrug resistance pump
MLAGAIVAEVIATLALRGAAPGVRLLPMTLVVTGYLISFVLMAYALKVLKVGVVYAIWSGIGTAGVSIAAALIYDERLNFTAVVGMALIVVGVAVLALSGSAAHG